MNIKKITKGITTKVIPEAVGGIACGFANNIIPASINPKIRAAGKLIIGAALPEFVKNKFVAAAAGGWNGVAGVELAQAFGMTINVSGIGEIGAYEIEEDSMNGIGDANDAQNYTN